MDKKFNIYIIKCRDWSKALIGLDSVSVFSVWNQYWRTLRVQ